MNIVQRLALSHPLAQLQTPSGWTVVKNNFIDADASILASIEDPLEQMQARENFFASDIFYAQSEHDIDGRNTIKAVIDVWCRPAEPDMASSMGYEVTLSLYKNKAKNSYYSKEQLVDGRHQAAQLVNHWMHSFSLKFIYALDDSTAHDPDTYFC